MLVYGLNDQSEPSLKMQPIKINTPKKKCWGGEKKSWLCCIICRSHQQRQEKLQLRTKPSYYIVLRRSPIIAGLMQVEIMAIISPAGVGDAGNSCQSHCVRRSMGVTLSITESLGQDIMLCYPPSPISTPSALPSLFHTTVFLLFSPSLPVSFHKPI